MMYLNQLQVDDGKPIYDLLQRIGVSENAFHNEVNGMTYSEFQQWLLTQDKWSKGEGLPIGYVRQWIYWLFDGDKPVGFGKLREKLTDSSRLLGGNIGYAIAEDQRGKGYGTVLFQLLLKKAQELGINEVMSTVEKTNPASRRVQEKCGGKLIRESDERWYFSFSGYHKIN